MLLEDKEEFTLEQSLEGWVVDKCQGWRNHFESNYAEKFDEYYRLWRGQWASEDKTRQSERSKIISPALQQAVESSVAELEEATFGRGKWFDITDEETELLVDACKYHSDGLVEGDITIQTCWDADRLELGRVGIKPSPERLCTEFSKRKDVIEEAYKRSINKNV